MGINLPATVKIAEMNLFVNKYCWQMKRYVSENLKKELLGQVIQCAGVL